jgi:predicted lipoprotein with Yx(FWY)xxD motif
MMNRWRLSRRSGGNVSTARQDQNGYIGRISAWIGAGLAAAMLLALVAAPTAGATPKSLPANAVVVNSVQTKTNRVLVTAAGFALYDFSGDNAPTITGCLPTNTGPGGVACTTAWPPLLATGPVVAGKGVNPKGLGTLDRPGIGSQVTYFGAPLYTFVNDKAPGQMTGEDATSFHGIWRLVNTNGRPSADQAQVRLELSVNGPVLAATTGFGTVRSLYELTADPPFSSTCTGLCAGLWPPLLTGPPAKSGPGVLHGALGAFRRADGTFQVTYFGHPLYLFAFDLGAGQPASEINGNGLIDPPVMGNWYTLGADGLTKPGAVTVETEPSSLGTVLAAPAVVGGGTTATLYEFSPDTPTASTCFNACARAWPPLLTSAPPVAGPGTDATKLSSIQRPDGSFQVTYAGHPLYYFFKGLDPSLAGEGANAFGGIWKVLTPAGVVS